MGIPADVQKLVDDVYAKHDGGDPIGYMVAAIMADREARDPHEEAEHFLRVAIDRSPKQLRQLGEYLSGVLDEDQFPRADRLLLGIAEVVSNLADALYAQVYEHGAVTSDAYALIDAYSAKAEENA